MTVQELVYKSRSIRRFDETRPLKREQLLHLVDLGRMSPSGMNLQWIRYAIVHTPALCERVYTTIKWAAYLPEWDGPPSGERPTGYIILCDGMDGKGLEIDCGLSAQSIMLGAVEMGLGCCMIAGVDRKALTSILGLPDGYRICYVLAIGIPKEEVKVVPIPEDGSIKYWREGEVHCVPKRSFTDVMIPLKEE